MSKVEMSNVLWRKSSRSASGGANCVEVGYLPDATAIRDSKNAAGPVLSFPLTSFAAPSDRLKRGDLG
jgi:uncharacterized protein DUF397